MLHLVSEIKNRKMGRSLISIVLSLTMLCSVIGVIPFVSATAEDNIWDGSVATSLSGSGTETEPYEIGNGSELALAITSGGDNKFYKLTKDIYLNDINKINWATGEVTEGYSAKSWYAQSYTFKGTIDGNGFTVYGLYRDENPGSMTSYPGYGSALIPKVAAGDTVTLKNLGVDCAYIEVECAASAFVASSSGTVNVDSCYAGEKVCLKGGDAAAFVGYVGADKKAIIFNSYSLATTNAAINNGFVGNVDMSDVTVNNCYNANGPIVSHNDDSYSTYIKVSNSYETIKSAEGTGDARYSFTDVTVISAENMQDEDVFTNSAKMPKLNSENIFVANTGYPTLLVFVLSHDDEEPEGETAVWDGSVATSLSGSGTETEPYEIGNGAELAYAITSGVKGAYYKLTANIYLNDITKIDWATGQAADGYTVNVWYNQNYTFDGTIDGNGKTVYGLYRDENPGSMVSYAGYGSALIPKVEAGDTVTVKNLGVDNAYIEVECEASAFVATSAGTVNIDSCYAGSKVYLNGGDAAVFRAGANGGSTSISNSYSFANLNSAASGHSGFVGQWSAVNISNSFNANGPIWSEAAQSEYYNVTISNCYESQTVGFDDAAVLLDAQNMQGTDVFTNSAKMPNLNTNEVFVATSGYPTLLVFGTPEEEEPEQPEGETAVWDGSVATSLSGSGTETEPYEIGNGAELAYAITSGVKGAYYKLTANIYLNDITKIDWATGQAADGYTVNVWYNQNYTFDGTIDGNGKTVYGLYRDENPGSMTSYAGYGSALVPKVEAGDTVTLKNLGVDNAYIEVECEASAFVATSAGTVNIDSCYAGSKVYLKGGDAAVFRAGANGGSTSISNSYSFANLYSSASGHSGFVGQWSAVNISNSFNANGPIWSEAAQSEYYNVAISNCYESQTVGFDDAAVLLDAQNMQGTDVFTNSAKMPNLNTNEVFVATSQYPTLLVFGTPEEEEPEQPENPEQPEQPEQPEGNTGPWDGSIATEFKKGSGTSKDPYLISTAAELAFAITSGGNNKTYKLANDIYLNDITKINWATGEIAQGYTPSQWYSGKGFSGIINGNGKTVYGLYFDDKITQKVQYSIGVGLVPEVKETGVAVISNLAVDNCFINSECASSAFVGAVKDTASISVNCCYVGENVTLNSADAGLFRGYTSGGASTSISNCYSLAKSVTGSYTYGLAGNIWGPLEIINSFNANGPILSSDERYQTTIAGCYQTVDGGAVDVGAKTISVDNMKDLDVFTNQAKMPNLNNDSVYVAVAGNFPILYPFDDSHTDDEEQNSGYWDGVSTTEPAKGNGEKETPYLISNAEELAYAIKSGGEGKYYKLTTDIYLNDIDKINWKTGEVTPGYRVNKWFGYSTQFYGTIDGDGHTVHGLYYNTPTSKENYSYAQYGIGLVPSTKEGENVTLTKLGVDHSFINFEHGASAFIGYAYGTSRVTVDQCYAGANVVVMGHDAGAFRGSSGPAVTTVFNCYSLASVSAYGKDDDVYSGLFGTVWGNITVQNSYNANGPIQSHKERYEVTITDCYQSVIGGATEESVTTLSVENMKGADVFTNSSKMPLLNKYGAFVSTTDFPTLSVFSGGKGAEPLNDEGVKGRVWSGKLATKYAGGTGTEADPYIIETPEQLALLVTIGGKGYHYKVTADLKLNDTSKPGWEKYANQWFTGMTSFSGVFDGNGHVVSGLYYYNQENTNATPVALFQRLYANSTVKRIGVINSKIVNNNPAGGTFAGAIVGWIYDYEPHNNPDLEYPVISECFADDTVSIEATDAGGLVGGSPTYIVFEDCYFTGELTGRNFRGTFVGDHWAASGGALMKNCYSASKDGDPIGGSVAFGWSALLKGWTKAENVYVDGNAVAASGLSVLFMRGNEAKKHMVGFDFNKVWQTVKNGTPVLRCFENAEQYSCTRDAKEVTISFDTLGGSKHESIKGISGYTQITEDMLPTPTRYGYLFKGWHHFNQYGPDFELTSFPNYDIVLVAAWEKVGFTNSFEVDLNDTYDYNEGIQIYKIGVENFKSKYVYSGWRSLHAMADSKVDPAFLLSYENALEVGKEYLVSIWVNTDSKDIAGAVKFLHVNKPDVRAPYVGYEEVIQLSNIKTDEWQKVEFKIVANAPYIIIESPKGASVFFDEISVSPTGNTGEVGKLKIDGATDSIIQGGNDNKSDTTSTIIIVIVSVVLALGVGAVATVVLIRRKKKQG